MGGVMFGQTSGINCTLPDPNATCELLCNPDFDEPTGICTPGIGVDLNDGILWVLSLFETTAGTGTPTTGECPDFVGWDNIYGTPDYAFGISTFTPTGYQNLMRTWATHAEPAGLTGCCERGEGIYTTVDIEPNTNYLLAYTRRAFTQFGSGGLTAPSVDTLTVGGGGNFALSCPDGLTSEAAGLQLDNLHVRLTNDSEITWNTSEHFQPDPVNFREITPTETNIALSNWVKTVRCFSTNATEDWNTLYLFPQQNECNGWVYTYFTQVELIKDDFEDAAITLDVSCDEIAAGGVDIGWDCAGLTDMQFSWEFKNASTDFEWVPLSNTTSIITVAPDESTTYRLSRSFVAANSDYTIAGDDCATTSIEIEVTRDDIVQCCIDNTAFTIDTDHPSVEDIDGQGRYTANASGTWTPASNDFVALGVASPGDDITLNIDLVVADGINLNIQNMNFNFGPYGRIIVARGGNLTLNNCNLDAVCEIVWQGIQVQGDNDDIITPSATLKIENNTRIKNAIFGAVTHTFPILDLDDLAVSIQNSFEEMINVSTVLLDDAIGSAIFYENAGGLINVFDSDFNNCFIGTYIVNNFDNASAIINSNYTGGGMYYPFNALEIEAEAGVASQYTLGYKVVNSNFRNITYGIRNNEARTFGISGSNFYNCSAGISSRSYLDAISQKTDIYTSNFYDCQISIQADASNRCIVVDNNINPGDGPYTSPYNVSVGIYIRGSNGKVEGNHVHNVSHGIVITDNGSDGLLIANNEISDNNVAGGNILKEAIISEGNNQAVEITCNAFINYGTAALDMRQWATTLDPAWLADQGQCSVGMPAGNTFVAFTNPDYVGDLVRDASAVNPFTYADINASLLNVVDASTAAFFLEDCLLGGTELYCSGLGFTPLSEISFITDDLRKNKALSKHLNELVAADNFSEALALIYAYNSSMTERQRIGNEINTNELTSAQTRLNTMPDNTDETLRYKQYYQLQIDVRDSGRAFYQLNADEIAELQDIANSKTKVAYLAQTWLYLAVFQEFEVPIPTLLNSAVGYNTAFKMEAAIANAYPNPASNLVQIPYSFSNNTSGYLRVFNVNGQEVLNVALNHSGTYQLPTANLGLGSGIYFYELGTPQKVVHKAKFVVIR